MFRVLLIALFIGVTVYALLDWGLNSRRQTPGGLSRWIWLAVIIVIPFLGPLTWIIMRLIADAEGRQGLSGRSGPPPGAPDDDKAFLDNLSWKIQRRQRGSKPQRPVEEERPTDDPEDQKPENGGV